VHSQRDAALLASQQDVLRMFLDLCCSSLSGLFIYLFILFIYKSLKNLLDIEPVNINMKTNKHRTLTNN
jgi:hypothetical protein